MRRVAAALAISLLSACATTSVTYVSNKSVGAYFTVPQEWFEVSERALDSAEFQQINSVAAQQRYDQVQWQVAYAPNRIKAVDVLASQPQEFPVVFVRVRNLSANERSSISLNGLRDLVFPVTSAQGTLPIAIDDDREVSQPGGSGVDLQFQITLQGREQTLRQIAILTPDRSQVYLFVLRCSTTCFKKNAEQISQIAETFTVRGASA